MSNSSSDQAGYLQQLIKRVNAATSIDLADKATLATLARTGAVAAAIALAVNLLSSSAGSSAQASGQNAAQKPHPGTAAARSQCENPAVPPSEFEGRFTATAARLSNKTFDFIVVGAGSAGCVLARRLSMDPSVTVLLLECGGEAQNATSVRNPNKAIDLWRSEVDWHFASTPQPQLNNRVIDLERGKTLGGSSCLNYNMWVRSAPEDFDRWANECGCGPEWSYANVLPNFNSLERFSNSAAEIASPHTSSEAVLDPAVRGTGGQMAPSVIYPRLGEVDCFVEACAAVGIPKNDDYNGTVQEGAGYTQMSVDAATGRRMDSFTCFVEPVLRHRPNLTVASEGFCTKVLFCKERRATGVRTQLPTGQTIDIHCSREVILCAGALNSPHLLMLSGVGDARKLHAHGIPVVADIPAVGEHLQDHPAVFVPGNVSVERLAEGFDKKRAASTGLNGVAFFKTDTDRQLDHERGSASGPTAEMIVISRLGEGFFVKNAPLLLPDVSPLFGADNNSFTHRFRGLRRTLISLAKTVVGTAAGAELLNKIIALGCVLHHPVSRGSLTLQSASPLDPVLVDVALLRDERDMKMAVEMIKTMRQVVQTAPFAGWFDSFLFLPGITSKTLGVLRRETSLKEFFDATDAQLREFVRRTAGTTWHYSCTARMGPADGPVDQFACDPQLRVRGVSGLRVADCSVAPFVVSANTNASAMMIGDKAAEFIYAEHGLKWRAESNGRARL